MFSQKQVLGGNRRIELLDVSRMSEARADGHIANAGKAQGMLRGGLRPLPRFTVSARMTYSAQCLVSRLGMGSRIGALRHSRDERRLALANVFSASCRAVYSWLFWFRCEALDSNAVPNPAFKSFLFPLAVLPSAGSTDDCLHWCEAGVTDAWIEVIYNRLKA